MQCVSLQCFNLHTHHFCIPKNGNTEIYDILSANSGAENDCYIEVTKRLTVWPKCSQLPSQHCAVCWRRELNSSRLMWAGDIPWHFFLWVQQTRFWLHSKYILKDQIFKCLIIKAKRYTKIHYMCILIHNICMYDLLTWIFDWFLILALRIWGTPWWI